MLSFTHKLGLLLICLCFIFSTFKLSAQIFEEVSAQNSPQLGYGINSEMGGGVNFVDFNKDGCEDLTLTSDSTLSLTFFLGQCDGTFNPINLSGIVHSGLAKHALWIDVDNDDDYDLFVSANDTGNKFYLNQGGLDFIDYTEESGIDSNPDNNSIGCVAADFNQDGNLDIYVSNRTVGGFYTPFSNIMYYGNGDGTFNDVTEDTNTQDSLLAPLCPVVLDFDKNGFPDVYIAQDKNFGNSLLRNLNGQNFVSYAEESESDYIMNGMNGEVIDINNDGFEDLYITNSYHGNILLINNQDGTFSEEAEDRGIAMFNDFCWGGVFADIDNDRDLDLYVCVSTLTLPRQDRFFINDGSGYFNEATEEYGFGDIVERSFGQMFCDFTSDGYPDLIVRNYTENNNIFINPGGSHHYFSYLLDGTYGNNDGIGSLVYVYVNGIPQVINHQCGRGWLSQSSFKKTVGLGIASAADSVIVEWPSGAIDKYVDVIHGSNLVFHEGETYSAEISSSEGLSMCAGSETVLSINGTYESVVWNGEIESETFLVSTPGVYEALITNQFGVQLTESIEISILNESLEVNISDELTMCPNESSLDVPAQVVSEEAYVILWNEEEGGNMASLGAGLHTITVIDELGCQASLEFEITHSEDLILNEIITNVSCPGENDGQLVLDITGSNPFIIELNEEESGILASNLEAGTYNVLITDANDCTITQDIIITEPDAISYDLITTPDHGQQEGSITVSNVSGGNGEFTLNGESTLELTNLEQGEYNLELCDQNDCCVEFIAEVQFQVGVEEIESKELHLFPNPVSDYLTVTLPAGYQARDLVIRDTQGRLIKSLLVNETENQVSLDLRALTAGKYFLETTDGELSRSFLVK